MDTNAISSEINDPKSDKPPAGNAPVFTRVNPETAKRRERASELALEYFNVRPYIQTENFTIENLLEAAQKFYDFLIKA